jgi:hypothetical protein
LHIHGTHPFWVDEATILYVAASPESPDPCVEPGRPGRNDLRLHDLSSGNDSVVAPSIRRAWRGGPPVPLADGEITALNLDHSATCNGFRFGISLLELSSSEQTSLPWTEAEANFTVGLLPSGGGFVVQLAEGGTALSRLYAVRFDGEARALLRNLDTFVIWPVGPEDDAAPGCDAPRRLGPACEVYCVDSTEQQVRQSLLGGEPEPVECRVEGAQARVVDVWQR